MDRIVLESWCTTGPFIKLLLCTHEGVLHLLLEGA
jgi:hypothetical protein